MRTSHWEARCFQTECYFTLFDSCVRVENRLFVFLLLFISLLTIFMEKRIILLGFFTLISQ